MSFSGNLKSVSFGDNLQLISTGKKTGALLLVRGKQQKRIYFQDGQVVFAKSDDDVEQDRLGQFLVRQGKITPEQLEMLLAKQKKNRKRLGEIILELHLLEPPVLAETLRVQVEEIIYGLFVWGDGEFKFIEGEAPPAKTPLIKIDTMSVMMEGARRFDEWNRIRETLPPVETVLEMRPVPLLNGVEISLSSEDFELLALVDGYRRVDEIMQTFGRGEYTAACSMHRLISKGLIQAVERTEDSTGGPDEWRSVYDIIFRLYSHSLQRIHQELTDLLGDGGDRLFVQPIGKRLTAGLFDSLIAGETTTARETFWRAIESIPENVRLHKVLSQATLLLRSRLGLVRDSLGDRISTRLVEGIQKDVAFLLAQKRVLADKYDIGREFADSLNLS